MEVPPSLLVSVLYSSLQPLSVIRGVTKLGTDSASSAPSPSQALSCTPAAIPHCGSCKCLALGQQWPLVQAPCLGTWKDGGPISISRSGEKDGFEESVGLG